MRNKTNLQFNPLCDTYSLFTATDIVYTQDPTHIGTKLRNRLLKPSISLPFGTKAISITHLKILLELAPKDVHGLIMSDIIPDDRQNFGSLEKIIEVRVSNALKKYVIDSDATIVYLNVCKNITSSYLDINLSPLDRVQRIWNAIFLLRIWRDFVMHSAAYNIEKNFISTNAYACIELNGLALIKLIVSMKNSPEYFLPSLFDSQVCEKTFRQMRSMGTMNYTKINFTMMELLHMISRIEIQNDIAYYRLANVATFPRITINEMSGNIHTMPSNEEIAAAVKQALKDAVECTTKFGMYCDEKNIQICNLKKAKMPQQ